MTQNYTAFLDTLPRRIGLHILDFECRLGRDLLSFKNLGHQSVGLDGSSIFRELARKLRGLGEKLSRTQSSRSVF